MNIKKTKVMMCSKLRDHSITVQGIDIEEVDSYTYLGKKIFLTNDTAGEVKRRLQPACLVTLASFSVTRNYQHH